MPLQTLRFSASPPSLQILNQLLLPHETVWVTISGARSAFGAIRGMLVRGAPAIALVAALAVAVEDPFAPPQVPSAPADDLEASAPPPPPSLAASDGSAAAAVAVAEWYAARLAYLVQSRPTAVNLSDAARKLTARVREVAAAKETESPQAVREAYIQAANAMLDADLTDNHQIGRHGADWLAARAGLDDTLDHKGTVVTICNTGSLATAGYGTAIGVIRSLHAAGTLRHVYYCETRPYNQGSRLTGYELVHDQIPATLITDSMAAALFRLKGAAENIVAVIVGADRIAANGDAANKIGTYGLAVLARHHGVRFLVAATRTTIDLRTASGADIVIEERPQNEVLAVKGPVVRGYKDGAPIVDVEQTPNISTAAPGTVAWNPAFDVTPAELIDGIVTEVGVAEKRDGRFALEELFRSDGAQVNGT